MVVGSGEDDNGGDGGCEIGGLSVRGGTCCPIHLNPIVIEFLG